MSLLAGALVVVFAGFHGAAALPWLTQPCDPEAGPDELMLRVPLAIRWSWLVASVVGVVGGVLLGFDRTTLGLILAGVGMADICGLAILNGFWMKGRPTVSYHALRIIMATLIFLLALSSG